MGKQNLIPFITTSQMIEVDRLMIEKFNIKLLQMMENAGRNLAELAINKYLNDLSSDETVIILAGTGGNGGGALVCARHLHNRGVKVIVCIVKNFANYKSVPAHQLSILKNLNIKIIKRDSLEKIKKVKLIIDGLIGYSLKGKLSPEIEKIIVWANRQNVKKLSLDVPTGMEAATGKIFSVAIKADSTLTLALPKLGFKNPLAKEYFGELYLTDISVPAELYKEPSLNIQAENIFRKSQIIKI